MKIENKEFITKDGVKMARVTTADERWYGKRNEEGEVIRWVPSVTWICGYYPKGIQFYKWLAEKGWDESQAIKNAAGDKGSKVHNAIESLLQGEEVKIDDKFVNNSKGETEELTTEEYEAIMSFQDWFNEAKPKILSVEFNVFSDEHNYAGTVDFLCEIEGEVWLIDFKTSQSVWPEYELQVSAYKHAVEQKIDKLGILQVGYRKNKKNYKLNEVEDKFELFLSAQKIWANEQAGVEPKQRDYPMSLKLEGVKKSK